MLPHHLHIYKVYAVAILKHFNSILKNAQPDRNDNSMDLFVYLIVLMVDKQRYVLVFC